MYYVYLIGSTKNLQHKTYVGFTTNLKNRLLQHNAGKGAKSTKGRNWSYYYFKKFNSKKKALSYEYSLKKNRKLRLKITTKFLATNQV